ncbi:MAG TPA: hypothetical protein VFC67_27830 [Prolixibacteraceae bacterium]|nr:hypothetical protein [Prolixibacteraceae bacterium]
MKSVFRKRWYLFIPLIIVGFAAFGFLTMHLWNWLMPGIFHLPELTFWQTIGLMLLSRLILGGFGGHHRRRHDHCRTNMHEKWEKMTPEERENFKEHIHMVRPPWICRQPQTKKE